MNKINGAIIAKVGDGLHVELRKYHKKRETYVPIFFGLFNKKIVSVNFYQDWIDVLNGNAVDSVYETYINRFYDFSGQPRESIDVEKLNRAKKAISAQWKYLCDDMAKYDSKIVPNKYAISPGNSLMVQAVLKGYFEENFEPTRTIG